MSTEFVETFFEGVECDRCGKQEFNPILRFAFKEAAAPLLPSDEKVREIRERYGLVTITNQ